MTIPADEASRNLGYLIERVNRDHSAVEIVSEDGSGILMAKNEYDALVETSYLLSSPRNAARLMASLREARDSRETD
ncbi:type II toxin-antitoxin system prevent-host-death family antitoxin [Arthrobacter sp. zg-Y916]|uniref:type II toxin-antitoxin system Phd/YefM family antitoxin n=1 Tax=Arthrobacter sp. zg-Y916 TaxID=2894190 RepID=UPI001E543A18|nr:type II toxin-antitoxin system prevent-host-death family antitoxin [Arthrobacter sp. zg-Y916]MCC9192737.1 type II toxin-antitoxin system prevent-host-death family antitoxin [Arthrobacter sp. zg-Y916]